MIKSVAILGSTGSIGTNALRVIDGLGQGYRVAALSAHRNVELLAEQCRQYRPDFAVVTDLECVDAFRRALGQCSVEVLAGPEGLEQVAGADGIDVVLTAIVGGAGLGAALAGAKAGKVLAIANKEPLVMAGRLITMAARENGARILPVDSEHSAIFQAMASGKSSEVSRILLTGSGGPFRGATKEAFDGAGLEEALNHPTWDMGPKITIDSATMMNKALEVIEARWLFDVEVDKIEVVVHPESIVHSMVEFVDGSVVAQLGTPDMCVPIQYALTWPDRVAGIAPHVDFTSLGCLHFERPDLEVFRSLKMAYEVSKGDDSGAVVFNAANEEAVAACLEKRIRFGQILDLVETALEECRFENEQLLDIDKILEIDREVRECVQKQIPAAAETKI